MKTSFVMAGILALACWSTAAVAADEQPAPPAPPAGALKLHAFVGHWTGTGEMAEYGKDKSTINVDMTCVEAAGGWGIRCDDAMTGQGMNYLETDLMGYDARDNQSHWYAVTNSGEVHDHVAQWKDDANFLANHTDIAGDHKISEDITLQLKSPTQLEAKSTVTVDGKESQSLTMTLTKSGKDKD